MSVNAPRRRKASAKLPTKFLELVEVTISRRALEAATTFSDNFKLTPESVMEGQFYSELEAFSDDVFQALEMADNRPPMVEPVTVTLEILSDAMDLARTVAKLLNRPLDWLLTLFVDEGVDLLWRQMRDAEEEGGINAHPDMKDAAKIIFDASLDARAAIFPKTGKYDAWVQLGLERPKKKEGRSRE